MAEIHSASISTNEAIPHLGPTQTMWISGIDLDAEGPKTAELINDRSKRIDSANWRSVVRVDHETTPAQNSHQGQGGRHRTDFSSA